VTEPSPALDDANVTVNDERPLTARAAELTGLITEVAVDEHHLVRTAIHADGLRPLVEDDVPPCPYQRPNTSAVGTVTYEDAGMATGAFLSSQCIRFRLTGDAEASENARRAFEGLRFIYELGREDREAGYFPKPYDARSSDQISRDQYLFAMTGLGNYHGLADTQTRTAIEQMLDTMADYWIDLEYTHSYFGLPPSSHLADYMGALFLGLIRLPYAFTGADRFLREYTRLFEEEGLGPRMRETLRARFLAGETYDGATYFRQNENPIMMKCMAIDHLWDADPGQQDVWRDALEAFWHDDLFIALDETDGMTYCVVGFDAERNATFLTEPGVIPGLTNPLNLPQLTWGGRRKRVGSAQTAYAATVIASRLGATPCAQKARLILEKLTRESFRGLTVPDERHIPPGDAWEQSILQTGYMSFWLWAYWLGRERGLWGP